MHRQHSLQSLPPALPNTTVRSKTPTSHWTAFLSVIPYLPSGDMSHYTIWVIQ
uniref:Uncharacterized protein n=1 Tax=Anguilla anguilla TaxID=7936 RepID=A0A0E9RTK1_ANGAN